MKKVYCVIFSVMLVVFTMIPVTAFAGTGVSDLDYKAIAKDNDITISEDYSYYFVYTKDVSDPDYCYAVFSTSPVKINSNLLLDSDTKDNKIIIVKYGTDNVYSNVTKVTDTTMNNYLAGTLNLGVVNPYDGSQYKYVANKNPTANTIAIKGYYSSYNVDNNGTTFQQTPSGVQPGTEGERPGVVLGATMKKTELSQVLSELVALLPILVPVLISFIAIRKGLRFTLSQLRAA